MKKLVYLILFHSILGSSIPLLQCVLDAQHRDFPRFQYTYPEQIESEHFIIHFTTSDADSQLINGNLLNVQCNAGYAQSIIDLAEYALDIYMVDGWEMMPPDCDESIEDATSPNHCNNFGGNALYDIYLANDAAGLVAPERPYPVEPYIGGFTSFMVVSTLLNEFYTIPYWNIHVVAHELHHAIQVRYGTGTSGQPGNYVYNGWLFEQTATYMENVVFPESIHLQTMLGNCDITTPLSYPEISIDSSVDIYQYRSALWQKFLVEAYGDSTINRLIWEDFGFQTATENHVDVFISYNSALQEITDELTNLSDAYKNYAEWRFFTGNRSIPSVHFMQSNVYCTAQIDTIENSPFELSTQKGASRFFELSPDQNVISIQSNAFNQLQILHLVVGENDEITNTSLLLNDVESIFELVNPNLENHAILVTSIYTNEESENIEFSLSTNVTFTGDINADNQVDVLDIVMQINIILHEIAPTEYQENASDLNGDGMINVLDVVMLVNIIIG